MSKDESGFAEALSDAMSAGAHSSNPHREASLRESTRPVRTARKVSTIKFAEFADDEFDSDDLDSDDSEQISRWSTPGFHSDETQTDENLIDNEMAQVVGQKASMDGAERAFDRANSMGSTKSQELIRFYRSTTRNEGSSRILTSSRKSGGNLLNSAADAFVSELFLPTDGTYLTQQHILMRQRMIKHIFALDELSVSIKNAINEDDTPKKKGIRASMVLPEWKDWRQSARELVGHTGFITFFLMMSIYAVFTPDIVALACPKEWDEPFSVLNTVVFVFLLFELACLMLADRRYVIQVPFILDVLVMISFLQETWFFSNQEDEDSDSQYSRAARSSRMTRLARIARVARITRLIPRVMQLFRKNKELLAKQLLKRRIRRAFLFLDTDNDGLLSFFDFKCFYFCVIKGCPEMLHKTDLTEYIDLDRPLLCSSDHVDSEHWNHYTFEDFSRFFFETAVGKSILNYHVEDIQSEKGVWRLTQKLTDSTTLKVCIGILVLVVTFNTLEVDTEDIYPEQGLGHLSVAGKRDHAAGGIKALTELCEQVNLYSSHVDVLFLHVDGWRYAPVADCLSGRLPETISQALAEIENIFDTTSLRRAELLQVCWPSGESCDSAKSVVLIDQRSKLQHELLWATVTTFTILVILLAFITLFNRGITNFSSTTMKPLHALADDMMAMSCLDLVHIDAEIAADPALQGKKSSAEELVHLQNAFKSMRGAIRSWSMYVPPALVQRLFSAGIEATIGVTRQKASVLFIDVDGFEDACRGLQPDKVIQVLSTVLANIAELIHCRRGTLLEFIGDEVLAVFNTPSALRNHVYAAVACALEIHQQVRTLLPIETTDQRQVPIRCRCGVHSAQVLAGNIGSHKRIKFGVLGDAINLTARLKGLNSRYQTETLTTDSVIADDHVARKCVFRPVDVVAVKGRRGSTTLYEIFGFAKSPEMVTAKHAAAVHTEAIELYQQRRFSAARKCFEEVARLQVTGHRDETCRLLIERCVHHIKNPPPDNWDFVERLEKKNFQPHIARDSQEQDMMTSLEVGLDFHPYPPACVHSKHVLRTRGLNGPARLEPVLRAAGRTPC